MTTVQQQARQFRRNGEGEYRRNAPWETARPDFLDWQLPVWNTSGVETFLENVYAAIEQIAGSEDSYPITNESTPALGAHYTLTMEGQVHPVFVIKIFKPWNRWRVRFQFQNGPLTAAGSRPKAAITLDQWRKLNPQPLIPELPAGRCRGRPNPIETPTVIYQSAGHP